MISEMRETTESKLFFLASIHKPLIPSSNKFGRDNMDNSNELSFYVAISEDPKKEWWTKNWELTLP